MTKKAVATVVMISLIISLYLPVSATTGIFPRSDIWWGHERAICKNNYSQYDGYWIQATIPTLYPRYANDGINDWNRTNVDSWFVYSANMSGSVRSWVEWVVARGDYGSVTKVEWVADYDYSTGTYAFLKKLELNDIGLSEFQTGENHTMGAIYNPTEKTMEMRSDNRLIYSFGKKDYRDIYLGVNRVVNAGLELHRNKNVSSWDIVSKPWNIYNCNTRLNGVWKNWKQIAGITIEDEISNNTNVTFDSVNNKINFN